MEVIKQARSHQIWSGQVGSARARTLYPRGVWGHAPPGKFWNLGAMRLFLRPILGQYDASRRPNNRVSHDGHCVVHQWCRLSDPVFYWPKATPFAGEACETNHSLVRTESCWKTHGTVLLHCSQPSRKFRHCTYRIAGKFGGH